MNPSQRAKLAGRRGRRCIGHSLQTNKNVEHQRGIVGAGTSTPSLLTQRRITFALAETDPIDPIRPEHHHKVYEVTLKAGQTYTIDLMSGDGRPGPHNPGYFDIYLRIEGPNAVNLSNDDGGEGRNSRITFTPNVNGTFRLISTSYAKGATGDFTLRVR